MPSAARFLFLVLAPLLCFADKPVLIVADEPGVWPLILNPVGIPVNQAADLPPAELAKQVEAGAIAVIVGESEYSSFFGIRATGKRTPVASIVDSRQPRLSILWAKPLELPVYELPVEAEIYAKERWSQAPLLAGIAKGKGGILWLAVPPGEKGYERFPYLVQALVDLGVELPLRSNRLWAFFDGAYRSRVDLDYLALRWRRAGIAALHVAAWHYMEPSADQDEFVKKLIAACHRNSIQVYAWLELPHVSEKFWHDQPQCREKTGLLQDAHLDWRKLINLSNRDCFQRVSQQVSRLLTRFDWDGVNLAELYFESLEGAANASRFTPMNEDVRTEYKGRSGTDPLELMQPGAPKDRLGNFLEYRADLARRMQEEWIVEIEKTRRGKPHLDLVLTHVDDRFDTRMRELIGADASRVLPLLARHDFTFLIEDPATIWHLGPERYTEIAKRYAPLTDRQSKLAIDINIVERYQDVYPTKQQTGTELFQLLHLASKAFSRVALYFENSILKPDLDLLSSSAAAATRYEKMGEKVIVESKRGIGVRWAGPALVNSRPWPVSDGKSVWLPPGAHVIQPGAYAPGLRIEDFNADLRSAAATPQGVEFAYESSVRAMIRLNEAPGEVELDGEPFKPDVIEGGVLLLPRGQHFVHIRRKLAEQTSLQSLP